jgi:L-amino acid N-acyltransferase YncA
MTYDRFQRRLLKWPALRSFYRRLHSTGLIECRIARESDAEGVARLMEPLFPPAARSEAFPAARRLLSETDRCGGSYHVALWRGKIAGGCQAGPLLKSAGFEGWWALGLWVHPAMRGRGIGSSLVSSVIDEAERRGEERIYCHIGSTNYASLGLFRRLGFQEASRDLRSRIEERFGDAFGGKSEIQAFSLDLPWPGPPDG